MSPDFNIEKQESQKGVEAAEKKPLVSFIMPCYNIAPFVGRAIASLEAQTYENWELIAVDDGSTDATGAILDCLAEEDEKRQKADFASRARIHVLHTKNQGAPAARNLALKKAQGTFIHFIDGDDWVEPDMLEVEVSLALRYNLQLVIAGFSIETYYKDLPSKLLDPEQFCSEATAAPTKAQSCLQAHAQALEAFLANTPHFTEIKTYHYQVYPSQESFRRAAFALFDENLLYTPWNKLFRADYIQAHHLQFRPTFWDDFPFVLDYIQDVEQVGVLPQPFYHFLRLRQDSETARWRKGMFEKREEEHDWMLDLYRHWKLLEDEPSFEMIQRRYVERLVGCIENVCNPACTLSRAEKRAEVKRMISTERTRRALQCARPHSFYMRLLLLPLRKENTTLVMAEGRLISFVKRHSTKVFARLKAGR